jgi:uncharacterized protein YdaU (DUF1376 family)
MYYWRNGGLPKDEERLARIAKLDAERWQSVRLAVAGRFNQNWRHKRIDEELNKAEEKSLKATIASAKSWEARGKRSKADALRTLKPTRSVGKASHPSFKSSLYDQTLVGAESGSIGQLSAEALTTMGIRRGAK